MFHECADKYGIIAKLVSIEFDGKSLSEGVPVTLREIRYTTAETRACSMYT